MSDKFTSNNIEDDEFVPNSEESDYTNLIFRLKEISKNIALVEKQYLDNL